MMQIGITWRLITARSFSFVLFFFLLANDGVEFMEQIALYAIFMRDIYDRKRKTRPFRVRAVHAFLSSTSPIRLRRRAFGLGRSKKSFLNNARRSLCIDECETHGGIWCIVCVCFISGENHARVLNSGRTSSTVQIAVEINTVKLLQSLFSS